MTRVKILIGSAGREGTWNAGDVVELEAAFADQEIAAGRAEPTTDPIRSHVPESLLAL